MFVTDAMTPTFDSMNYPLFLMVYTHMSLPVTSSHALTFWFLRKKSGKMIQMLKTLKNTRRLILDMIHDRGFLMMIFQQNFLAFFILWLGAERMQ